MLIKYQNRKFSKRQRLETPNLSTQIILNDYFLLYNYRKIYTQLLQGHTIEQVDFKILEIGSAGGVLKEIFPFVITSDVREGFGVDLVIDVTKKLPFADNSIDLILAKDVLHHISDVNFHFREIQRVLKPGAEVRYIEPNWNFISNIIFTFLHPEPFIKTQKSWSFESDDPMYSNQALPFIIFRRDISKFKQNYPDFSVEISNVPINGLAFLLSGGIYRRTPLPGSLLKKLDVIEAKCSFWMRLFGLNRLIILKKYFSYFLLPMLFFLQVILEHGLNQWFPTYLLGEVSHWSRHP